MNSSAPETSMPPPEGWTVQLVNPPYNGYQSNITCAVCMFLSTFTLAVRLYTRKVVVKNLGLDDLAIIIAWFGAMLLAISDIVQTRYGAGVHLWDVLLPDFEVFLKLQMIDGTGYIISTAFAKISMCTFYLRLSRQPTFRMVVLGAIVFVAADSTAVLLVYYFSCSPIAASWDPILAVAETTRCINRPAEYLAQAGINIFCDFVIFLIPVHTIWNLQLPFRQRVGVIAVFATGFFVCVVSIIRIKAIVLILNTPDLTWETTNFAIWSNVEVHIGVVCSSMTTFKPILKKVLPCLGLGKDSTPNYPSIQGRSTKLPSDFESNDRQDYALKSYRHNVNHETTVVGGGGPMRADSDADSQEHIIDRAAYHKDGVYVTRTVEVM